MADHVLHRLDAAEVHACLDVGVETEIGEPRCCLHASVRAHLSDVRAERGNDALVHQERREDPAREVAQLFERGRRLLAESVEGRLRPVGIALNQTRRFVELRSDVEQLSLRALADISFEAAPLGVARGDEPFPRNLERSGLHGQLL